MASSQSGHPPSIRLLLAFVGDMEQALAFYGHLGLATTYHGEGFAIVERDRIALHFNVSEGHSVAWISVTNIEAVYQHYLPTALFSLLLLPSKLRPGGRKNFGPAILFALP